MHSINPSECLNSLDVCRCFHSDALDSIARNIRESQVCQFELEESRHFVATVEENPWYVEPTFVVSGVVVGVSLAGVLGYLVGSRK